MTTPHQGPGMWQQGDFQGAVDWLARLDARQQERLRRAVEHRPAMERIRDAVSRVSQVAGQQTSRLSGYGRRMAGNAREFGQATASSVSRWFPEKRSNASNRAQAAGAAFAAFRQDPTLHQSGVSPKELLEFGQRFQALVTAQTPEAAQQLVEAAERLHHQQTQEPGTGRHRAENNPGMALQGIPPASQAVAPGPATQQGEAAKTTQVNTHRKPGQER